MLNKLTTMQISNNSTQAMNYIAVTKSIVTNEQIIEGTNITQINFTDGNSVYLPLVNILGHIWTALASYNEAILA